MSDPIQLLNYIKEAVDRVEGKIDGHDERLRTVENWQSKTDGKITMFGVLCTTAGGAFAWIVSLFKH